MLGRVAPALVLGCAAAIAAAAGAAPPARWAVCHSSCPGERNPAFAGNSILFWQSPSASAPAGGLWHVQPNGTGLRRVAATGASIFTVSPQGDRIALGDNALGAGLTIVSLAGGKTVRLPAGDPGFASASVAINPAWSRHGTEIAYQVHLDPRGGNVCCEIWVANADGTGAHKVADGGTPAWLPDGRVVFAAGSPGKPGGLAVVDADGTGLEQLTPSNLFDGWPAPSPDGRLIAFFRALRPEGPGKLWVVRSDGSAAYRVEDRPHGLFAPVAVPTFRTPGQGPVWDPLGKRVAFLTRGADGPELRVVGAAGAGDRVVADGVSDRARPSLTRFAWSPTGKAIVYLGGGNASAKVCPFVVKLAARRSTKLPCP